MFSVLNSSGVGGSVTACSSDGGSDGGSSGSNLSALLCRCNRQTCNWQTILTCASAY